MGRKGGWADGASLARALQQVADGSGGIAVVPEEKDRWSARTRHACLREGGCKGTRVRAQRGFDFELSTIPHRGRRDCGGDPGHPGGERERYAHCGAGGRLAAREGRRWGK